MNGELEPASRNVLLVEGLSDFHFVRQLRDQVASELDFDIDNKRRLSQLLDAIKLEITAAPRDVVGIMVDADACFATRWGEIVARLREANVSVPNRPDPCGTIIEGTAEHRRIGVWIMPDNHGTGELEDLVVDMIPGDDTVWPMSRSYIRGIPVEERKFKANKTLRAKLYAWLATRELPPHIGAAIGSGDFNLKNVRCRAFVDWLDRLYGSE